MYVLNLGTDANGNGFGYRKMSVQNYTTFYNVTFANLDGTDAHEVTVPRRMAIKTLPLIVCGRGHCETIRA